MIIMYISRMDEYLLLYKFITQYSQITKAICQLKDCSLWEKMG